MGISEPPESQSIYLEMPHIRTKAAQTPNRGQKFKRYLNPKYRCKFFPRSVITSYQIRSNHHSYPTDNQPAIHSCHRVSSFVFCSIILTKGSSTVVLNGTTKYPYSQAQTTNCAMYYALYYAYPNCHPYTYH